MAHSLLNDVHWHPCKEAMYGIGISESMRRDVGLRPGARSGRRKSALYACSMDKNADMAAAQAGRYESRLREQGPIPGVPAGACATRIIASRQGGIDGLIC